MGVCTKITAGVALSCTDNMVSGADDRLILINAEDITGYTRNMTNPQIIEAIAIAMGEQGYVFEGKQQSVEPSQRLVKTRYATAFEHDIIFKIFDASPTVKEQLELLVQGKFVAIVENNYQKTDGSGAFEIYGVDAGLYLEVLERTINDTETLGAFNVQLKTGEFAREGHLPASFFLTDYATTKALVDATLSPAP